MIGGLVTGNSGALNDVVVSGGVSGNYRSDFKSLGGSQYIGVSDNMTKSTVLNLNKYKNPGQVPLSKTREQQQQLQQKSIGGIGRTPTQKLQPRVREGTFDTGVTSIDLSNNTSMSGVFSKSSATSGLELASKVEESTIRLLEKKFETLIHTLEKSLLEIRSNVDDLTNRISDRNDSVEFRMSNYDTSSTVLQQEVEILRDEIQYASIGRIKAVVRSDTNLHVEKSVASGVQETILAGGHVWLQSPYDENSEGIWATKQTLSVTDKGLELKGIYCLIASSNGNTYEPLVDVVTSM